MYTYEKLLKLSALNKREGEEERLDKRFKALAENVFPSGKSLKEDTVLREDEAGKSVSGRKIRDCAIREDKGYIIVSEDYYEGDN